MTTMALVPQVVDAVSVPVIAAGGIADGRQLAAALALGACGVQVGTCLLASEECPIHENYKAALLKAKDSDTIVTGRSVGAPVRVLKNRMSREYVRQEKAVRHGRNPSGWRQAVRYISTSTPDVPRHTRQ